MPLSSTCMMPNPLELRARHLEAADGDVGALLDMLLHMRS